MKNIVLVGFMGCGKSMTSKRLAEVLNRPVVSTDKLIEEKEGRPIFKIFEDSGEPYFRQLEREVVNEISKKDGLIIDCGGGTVLDTANLENLRKSGNIFYLSASPGFLYENIKEDKHRPLLNVEDPESEITRLLEFRKPYYEKADAIIDADYKTIDQITENILKVLNNG